MSQGPGSTQLLSKHPSENLPPVLSIATEAVFTSVSAPPCYPGSLRTRAGTGTAEAAALQYCASRRSLLWGSASMCACCVTPALLSGPTSGWNCCSVRVWQYWQASPFSHLPGSPHSSPCLTFGHGDDLVQQEGVGQQQEDEGGTCTWILSAPPCPGLLVSQVQVQKWVRSATEEGSHWGTTSGPAGHVTKEGSFVPLSWALNL